MPVFTSRSLPTGDVSCNQNGAMVFQHTPRVKSLVVLARRRTAAAARDWTAASETVRDPRRKSQAIRFVGRNRFWTSAAAGQGQLATPKATAGHTRSGRSRGELSGDVNLDGFRVATLGGY